MQDKITLKNGLTVLFDKIDTVRSASVGIWINNGSIHETEETSGISHFIEHMAFKGTKTRTAADLARELDRIGGQANAFTAKEMTCFHIKVLDTHVEQALEILSDMVLNPLLSRKDITLEKNVIAEEIAMTLDTPDEMVIENLTKFTWAGSPLAGSILGTVESISPFTVKILKDYLKKRYTPNNMIVSVSGSFDREKLLNLIESRFHMPSGKDNKITLAPDFTRNFSLVKKEIEQTHLCLGFPIPLKAEEQVNNIISVLNCILGSGMSSRLFQSVREEKGLVYSISSFPMRHKGCGMLCIYAALNGKSQKKALELIKSETLKLLNEGMSDDELIIAKEQLKSGLIMGLESTSARSAFMGRSQMLYGFVKTQDELIAGIDLVTKEDVAAVGKQILQFDKAALSVVGTPNTQSFYEKIL